MGSRPDRRLQVLIACFTCIRAFSNPSPNALSQLSSATTMSILQHTFCYALVTTLFGHNLKCFLLRRHLSLICGCCVRSGSTHNVNELRLIAYQSEFHFFVEVNASVGVR